MNIALNTNACSDFMRGLAERVEIVRAGQAVVLPFVVLGELRAGFAAGNQQSTNTANLQRFLASPRVSVLMADEQTTHYHAQLHRQLREGDARCQPTTCGSQPSPCSTTWCSAHPTTTFGRFRSS